MILPVPHNAAPTLAESTAPGRIELLRPLPSSASDVPTTSAAARSLAPSYHAFDLNREFHRKPLQQIYSPRQAPSAVTTENFLAARALMTDAYVHDIASTKRDRISDLYRDTPRFQSCVNILA